MGKKNRNRVVEKVSVLSDGQSEIFAVPEEELKEVLNQDTTEKRNFMAKIVDVDLLNIRSTPNGSILSQVSKSERLAVVDINPVTDSNGEDWYNVVLPIGLEGWAMGKFLYIYEEGNFEEV